MGAEQRPVTVGVDGSVASELAVTWGIAEARARRVPLRLVHVYQVASDRPPDRPGGSPQEGRHRAVVGPWLERRTTDPYARAAEAVSVLADALAATRGRAADLAVTGATLEGDRVAVLVEESDRAELLVVGARGLGRLTGAVLGSVNTAVSARGSCPVVVVRGLAGYPEGHVVVGVDCGPESDTVLEFAFDHASRRRLPLRAVLCHRPRVASRRVVAGRAFAEDAGRAFHGHPEPAQTRRTESAMLLSSVLGRWQDKYPDVPVEQRVAEAHPVDGLLEESLQAQLLVVGRAAPTSPTGVLGSVSQGALHHATSPVAVVPTADRPVGGFGPANSGWSG